MKAYLKSNAVACRGSAPIPYLWQITILMISVIGHLHTQETKQTQA